MKVYLIRHGATPGNLEKRYVGSTDESLTREAVTELKNSRRQYPVPRRVVTSPMQRCRETASILFPGIDTEIEEGLRECDFGAFEYKNYLELSDNADYQRWIDSGGTVPFPDGESQESFKERSVRSFLSSLKRMWDLGCESAAYTVHGGTIMAVMEMLCQTEKTYFEWQMGNGKGFELQVDEKAAEELFDAWKENDGLQDSLDTGCEKTGYSRILKYERELPLPENSLHVSGIEDHFVIQKNKRLQCGYTTGSCAAAAAMAASQMLLSQRACSEMKLITPNGTELMLEIGFPKIERHLASCAVRKFGGDDPDATDGLLIFAAAELTDGSRLKEGEYLNGIPWFGKRGDLANADEGSDKAGQMLSGYAAADRTEADTAEENPADVILTGGSGVGRVTKAGLEQPVGFAAINRVPRQMITKGVREVCRKYDYSGTMRITVSVQGGEEVGRRTFNPHLGIVGGISILGTSGIVVPMSEQSLIESIRLEMRQKVKNGERYLLITPGNYGADFLKGEEQYQMLRPEFSMKCSNYVGETLDMAVELGVNGILFVSHIGKFGKVSGGIMNTHSARADCRAELMAAQAMRGGADFETVQSVLNTNTTEEAVGILKEAGCLDETIRVMTERIQFYLQKHVQKALRTEVVLFSNQYGYLGESEGAGEMMEIIADEKKRLYGSK